MRIAIITDTWKPQVNGVVTTLGKTDEFLADQGHQVRFITSQDFKTFPCPSYPEIRLALFTLVSWCSGTDNGADAFAKKTA